MTKDDSEIQSDKLSALRSREAALFARIAEEKKQLQLRREREFARLVSILGKAIAYQAMQSSDFRLMIQQVLQSAELSGNERSFLAKKGWL